jgi:exodeoxyribonuclease III
LPRLRITTWNANSVRLRADALRRIMAACRPDVLCLQETKVEDDLFPLTILDELGLRHRHLHGQKSYNGVAILSRLPLGGCRNHKWCGIDHCRHAVATLPGGIEVHNLYVPAGGDVPDPEVNPKFRHKLDMIGELTAHFAARAGDGAKIVLVGDLNIAPLETDVWSHRQLLGVVSHTPVETEAMARWQGSYGFVDAVRAVIPPDQKLYSWWSYRNRDWAASDRGRRLDHVWLSPALAPSLVTAEVLREARGWPEPSDHVPVTVELEV